MNFHHCKIHCNQIQTEKRLVIFATPRERPRFCGQLSLLTTLCTRHKPTLVRRMLRYFGTLCVATKRAGECVRAVRLPCFAPTDSTFSSLFLSNGKLPLSQLHARSVSLPPNPTDSGTVEDGRNTKQPGRASINARSVRSRDNAKNVCKECHLRRLQWAGVVRVILPSPFLP